MFHSLLNALCCTTSTGYSKYESGKAKLEMRDVNVQELMEQAIELAFKPSPAKDLDVRAIRRLYFPYLVQVLRECQIGD